MSLTLLLSALILGPARAEEPLWGEIASTLGQGFVNVTTRGSYGDTKPFRHHGGAVTLSTDRVDVAASLEYGLQPDVDLRVRIPYFQATFEERFSGQPARHTISGLGEMRVGTKWRFWKAMDARRKDEVSLLADVKLPTGNEDVRDKNGSFVLAHLQPNTGNLGIQLGLAANRHTPKSSYWFSGMVAAEEDSTRYQRGTTVELHTSIGRRLLRLARPDQSDWMGIVGLHYHRMGREKEAGQTLEDSGGSVLSVELGLVGSKRNRGARLGILFPVRTNLGLAHPPPRREIQGSIRAAF